MATCLNFAKLHLNTHKTLRTTPFGQTRQAQLSTNISYEFNKHADGGLMTWALFRATGPGHLAVTELAVRFSVYLSSL